MPRSAHSSAILFATASTVSIFHLQKTILQKEFAIYRKLLFGIYGKLVGFALFYFLFQTVKRFSAKKLGQRYVQAIAYFFDGGHFRAVAFAAKYAVNG